MLHGDLIRDGRSSHSDTGEVVRPRGDAPGISPDADRIVIPGVVVDLIPGLGPITVPTGLPLSASGHFEDPARVVAAVCAALSA